MLTFSSGIARLRAFLASPAGTWLGRIAAALFILFCLEPSLGGQIRGMMRHGSDLLGDFDAILCGASADAQGQSPYSLHPVCPGLKPAVFVYAPQIAEVFSPLVKLFGIGGVRIGFVFFLVAATAVLIWHALFRPMPGVSWQRRLLAFSAIPGGVLGNGNIALIFHALNAKMSQHLGRFRWLFIIAVILGGAVKPILLTSLVVLLLEDRPLRARMSDFALACGSGLAVVAALIATSGARFATWQAVLHVVVLQQAPGDSLIGGLHLMGITPFSLLGVAMFLMVSLLLTAAGMGLAQWGGLSTDERCILGLGLAQLLNPRLQNYDLFLLLPAMVLVIGILQRFDKRLYIAISVGWIALLLASRFSAAFWAHAFGLSAPVALPLSYLANGAIVLTCAAIVAWHKRALGTRLET